MLTFHEKFVFVAMVCSAGEAAYLGLQGEALQKYLLQLSEKDFDFKFFGIVVWCKWLVHV